MCAIQRSMDQGAAGRQFEDFLADIDDQIEWFEDEAHRRGVSLTRGMADLEPLEALFDELSKGAGKDVLRGLTVVFVRYLGEVLRESFGGTW